MGHDSGRAPSSTAASTCPSTRRCRSSTPPCEAGLPRRAWSQPRPARPPAPGASARTSRGSPPPRPPTPSSRCCARSLWASRARTGTRSTASATTTSSPRSISATTPSGIVLEADSFEFHGERAAFGRDCERYDELVVARVARAALHVGAGDVPAGLGRAGHRADGATSPGRAGTDDATFGTAEAAASSTAPEHGRSTGEGPSSVPLDHARARRMPSRWLSGTAYVLGWVASQTEAANAFSKMSRPSESSSSLAASGGRKRKTLP